MDLVEFPVWFTLPTFFLLTCVSKGTIFDMTPSMETYYPRYDLYHNLSRINECLRDVSAQYSDVLRLKMAYTSRFGLAQYLLHISDFSENNSQKTRSRILLSYGEHAAELFPVQSMFYLLDNITRGYDLPLGTYGRNFTQFVLNNIDLYIVTIVNPDGRIVVEKTGNHCWIATANYIDLNADHGVKTGTKTMNRIITEPECKVIRELTSQKNFDVFVSFHSGERKICFPHQGKMSNLASGGEDTESDVFYLASIIASVMKLDVSLVPVNSSIGGESIFAYASQEKKIPFTYKLSLWASGENILQRPNNNCFGFYNPPSEDLKAELKAIHPIYPALFHYVTSWKKIQRYKEMEKNARLQGSQLRSMSHSSVVFIIIMVCIGIYLLCILHVPSTRKMFYRRQRRIVSLRTLGTLFSTFSML